MCSFTTSVAASLLVAAAVRALIGRGFVSNAGMRIPDYIVGFSQ